MRWAQAVKEWNSIQFFKEDLYGIPKKGGEYYDDVKAIMEGSKYKKDVEKMMGKSNEPPKIDTPSAVGPKLEEKQMEPVRKVKPILLSKQTKAEPIEIPKQNVKLTKELEKEKKFTLNYYRDLITRWQMAEIKGESKDAIASMLEGGYIQAEKRNDTVVMNLLKKAYPNIAEFPAKKKIAKEEKKRETQRAGIIAGNYGKKK